MAGPEIVGQGEVQLGVDTTLAEAGMKRMMADFDRSMQRIAHTRSEATITANTTDVDRKITKVKGELLELTTDDKGIPIKLKDKQAIAEVKELRGELRLLTQQKNEIRVDAKELRDANKEMAISAKRQSEMSKQYIKETKAKRDRRVADIEEYVNLQKLEQEYIKLSKARSRLEREGAFTLGGFPGRTKEEERNLKRTAAEMDLVGEKIRALGGDLDGLDKQDRFGYKLLGWASKMKQVRVSMGPFSARLGVLIASLTTLGPIILSLVGGLSSLVGVLGAGLVGATAAASAGLGGLALSLGGVFLVAKGLVKPLQEQVKSAEAYHKAVVKYGKGSEQAKTALEQLHQTTKSLSPAGKEAIKNLSGLKSEWEKLTKPSQKPFYALLNDGLKTAKSLMPEFARETNATFKTLQHSVGGVFKELRSGGAKKTIHDLMSNFREALPDVVKGFANIGRAIGNVSDEASKFLPEIAGGFEKWTKDLADETGTEKFKHKLDEMIHQAGDILHLFNVAGKAIVLFFGAGAEAGDEMTNSLSRTIERWNKWMKSTEGHNSLHDFFHQSAEDTSNFFGALVPLLATFTKLTYALQPVTSGMLAFANILGKIVTEFTKFAPVRPLLEALGVTLGILFVANKVRAWSTALQEGYRWLLKLPGSTSAQAAANAELAASYDAVAASAEAANIAQGGGVVGVGGGVGRKATTTAAEDVGAYGEKQAIRDVGLTGGGAAGASLSSRIAPAALEALGTGAGLAATAGTAIVGAALFNPDGGLVNAASTSKEEGFKHFQKVEGEFKKTLANMKATAIEGVPGIRDALSKALELNPFSKKRNEHEWRQSTAKAMRGAVGAIEEGMKAGTIPVKRGEKEINRLLRQINVTTGKDPFHLGEAAAQSFKQTGSITRKGVHEWINELKEMPKGAREQARAANAGMLKAWADGHPKIEKQVQLLTQMEKNKFGANNKELEISTTRAMAHIAASTAEGAGKVGGAIRNVFENMEAALSAMGSKDIPHFSVAVLGAASQYHHSREEMPTKPVKGGRKRQQTGGFTVPGRGDGDQFPFEAEEGGFVLNREAARVVGFQNGGVPTLLEPGERYFPPHEVARIGMGNLQAANQEVSRFAKGGEPRLKGVGAMLDVGQGGIGKVYKAAQKYIQAHRPKTQSGGFGIPSFKGAWVKVMQKIAKAKHWSLSDWKKIIDHESGGQVSAQNPESTAFGLGQLLDMNWPTYGGGPGSNGTEQIIAMAKYIADRYGNPTKAWAEEEAIGTYKRGGAVQRLQEGGTATRAVNWAKHNVGVKQGGHRYDKWIAETGRIADPWCAEFVAADMIAQGVPIPGNPSYTGSYGSGWAGGDVVGSGLASAKPGDLLAFGSDDHIGIYVGGGMVIAGNWEDKVAEYRASEDDRGVSRVTRPHYPGGFSDPHGRGSGATSAPKGPKKGSTGKGGGTNAPPGSASAKEIANTVVAPYQPGKVGPALAGQLPKDVLQELRQPGLTREDRSGILSAYQGRTQGASSRANTKLEKADEAYAKAHAKYLAHPTAANKGADEAAEAADTAARKAAQRARRKEIKAAKAILVPLQNQKKATLKRIHQISKELGKKGMTHSDKERLRKERSNLFGVLATLQTSINEELEIINQEAIPPDAVENAVEEAAEAAENGEGEGASESGKEGPTRGEETATISGAREDLFNSYASNITGSGAAASAIASSRAGGLLGVFNRTGGNPGAGLLGQHLSLLGGHGSTGSGPGIINNSAVYNLINNFSAPPADPHTWTRQQLFELGALT